MGTRTTYLPESSIGAQGGYVRAIATIHAGAAPGANADCFTAVKLQAAAPALRITICLTTGSKVDVRVTDGTTAYSQTLNNNTALTAGCLYTFTIGARRFASQTSDVELTYSIRLQTDSIIQTLNVEEVLGPVI